MVKTKPLYNKWFQGIFWQAFIRDVCKGGLCVDGKAMMINHGLDIAYDIINNKVYSAKNT